ncbi:Lrp/AsnC family transcriptional regulator [Streptomyces platensis]|uniref:Lrp/AsnC family transcriptional regulator n=1 Tax=Streptomyces platensis TaxID=58346 RepID=UPI0030DE2504
MKRDIAKAERGGVNSTGMLDKLDQRILNGLQINPRVGWRTLAEALGENDRTVARRGQRLLAAGIVQVTAIPEDALLGGRIPVHVCAQVPQGALEPLAEELSARQDVRTVLATTGRSRLWFEVVTPGDDGLHSMITQVIPDLLVSDDLRTHVALRTFSATSNWHAHRITDDEAAFLRTGAGIAPASGSESASAAQLDTLELRILNLLQHDGRIAVSAMAEELGTSVSAAGRRLSALLSEGRVRVRAETSPAYFGLGVEAQLHLTVPADQLESAGRYLARRSEVRYCAAVTDSYALLLDIAVPEVADIYEFITATSLDLGIVHFEVSLITKTYKRGGLRKDGTRTLEFA